MTYARLTARDEEDTESGLVQHDWFSYVELALTFFFH